MPSLRPPFIRNHFYHFYNRGFERAPIFRGQENYIFVLNKIKQYCQNFELSTIAYCLLPNHYHILVRQDGDYEARLLPQRVFNSYSKAFNKRYNRSGTLFQGPYKVVLIKDEFQLLHVCRYIHANPVKHGLVEELSEWQYSNYLEWIRRRNGTLVEHSFVEDYFPTPKSYTDFVLDYLNTKFLPVGVKNYLTM